MGGRCGWVGERVVEVRDKLLVLMVIKASHVTSAHVAPNKIQLHHHPSSPITHHRPSADQPPLSCSTYLGEDDAFLLVGNVLQVQLLGLEGQHPRGRAGVELETHEAVFTGVGWSGGGGEVEKSGCGDVYEQGKKNTKVQDEYEQNEGRMHIN